VEALYGLPPRVVEAPESDAGAEEADLERCVLTVVNVMTQNSDNVTDITQRENIIVSGPFNQAET
jgi:hypothetical protein